jgi:AraC family transcriptional regulator
VSSAEHLACGCPVHRAARREAGPYSLRRSWYLASCNLGRHSHPEARIILTVSGRFETRHGSRSVAASPAQAVYRPALDVHTDRYDDAASCIAVLLPASTGHGSDLGDAPYAAADETFPELALELSREIDCTDTASALVSEALCEELLLCFTRARYVHETHCPRWLHSVREWIEDEYAAPPSLSRISQVVNRDSRYVATAFRRRYGKTIGEYVRELRIWHARKLVVDPDVPLAEVAQAYGFSDQSHFSRLFRRRFSLTPGEYRRRAR